MTSLTTPHLHPSPRRRAAVAAGAAVLLVVLAGVVADGALRESLDASYRTDVERRLTGYVSAVELAVAEYVVVVDGLAAWLAERPQADEGVFRSFAAAQHAASPEILALNRIRGSVVTDVFPREPNRAALGLDLSQHPDTAPPAALARSLSSGRTTLGGPVELAQGGPGLLFFRRASTGENGPVTAEVVIALETLLSGTGIPELARQLDLEIATGDGRRVTGSPIPDGAAPVEVTARLADGRWHLRAAPADGWWAGIRGPVWTLRAGLGVLALLLGVVVFGAVDRQDRLAAAVVHRTGELREANRELERTAEELAAQREMRQAAMSAGGVDVWSWDVERDLIERAGALRPIHAELRGETVAEFLDRVHADDRAHLEKAISEARRSGSIALEFRERSDRGWTWLRLEGRTSEEREGSPVRIIGAAADISKLKQLESEVLHRGRLEMVGHIAGGVVHDINNALTVVIGELEMALEDDADTPLPQAAREAHAAARYASLLTGQLLTFARKDRVEPTTFAWDGVCQEAAGFIDRVVGSGVRLELDMTAGDRAVRMDRTHALQILVNLATNARDAMEGEGLLRLVTRPVDDGSAYGPRARRGPAVVTEVSDSGLGIPPEAREHVFEAFFTTKGRSQGTGLGLSTARRIALDAGGDITFSTSEDGTTFVVVIPTAQAAVSRDA